MVGAHLLAVVCVAIAAGFGVWQLEAWQARRDAERVDLTHADPVEMTALLGPDDPFPGDQVGQPVEIDGTWVPDGTVRIADRESGAGEPGSWVVTPLAVDGPDGPAVPVVRGWLAEGDDVPDPPTGEGRLVGWLQPSEGTGAVDDDPSDDVLPQLRVADLVQRVPNDLYDAYVVLDPAATLDAGGDNTGGEGIQPASLDELPPPGRFTALRNLLYAIEWFVFAAFAAFIWWRFVRDERREEPDAHPDAEVVGDAG